MRTDLAIVQYPSVLPPMGGFLGVNRKILDPDFKTSIIRVTDGKTANGKSLQTADAAQAGIWNQNDTMLLVRDTGGIHYLKQFSGAAGLVTDVNFNTNDSVCFSKVHPGVLYVLEETRVYARNFNQKAGIWTYTPVNDELVCDFAKILPSGYNAKWQSAFLCSQDDSTFTVGFSDGVQNSCQYVCSFQRGHHSGGYRMLNTQTGTITGDWGSTGKAVIQSQHYQWPLLLHEVYQTPNNAVTALTPVGLNSTNFIWTTATTQIIDCEAGGHKAYGMRGWFGGGPGGGQLAHALYLSPSITGKLLDPSKLPASMKEKYQEDLHFSFGKYTAADASVIWASSGGNGPMPFLSAWENEIIGYDTANAIVYRLCHTFDSNESNEFIVRSAIACPSQSGRFVAFTTDWMGEFGSFSGGDHGTLKVDARGDVCIAAVGKTP